MEVLAVYQSEEGSQQLSSIIQMDTCSWESRFRGQHHTKSPKSLDDKQLTHYTTLWEV